MKDPGILYLTSFNEELYKATGRKLLKSFLKFNIEGNLFVGYENALEKTIIKQLNAFWETSPTEENTKKTIIYKSLEKNKLLIDWLYANEDIIPRYLGGKANPCTCSKNPFEKSDTKHKKGCTFTWWNRNCSRWFRKIVVLNLVKNMDYEYLIWLDSDCLFINNISYKIINKLFAEKDYFYIRGSFRPVDETGVFGIRLNTAGKDFITHLTNRYLTKDYRKDVRWDDSYQLMMTRKHTQILQKDILPKKSKLSCVIGKSELRKYIAHNKGTHGRILGIMK